jgi:PEP-CTERM motif-containing protein
MRPKTLLVLVALVVALLVSAPQTFAQNLVQNGSFETGDFTDWTTSGNFEFMNVVTGPFGSYSGAQDGNWYVAGGPVGDLGTISQTFNDTAGAQYVFSFYMNAVGDDPSEFVASWNGTPLLDLSDPNTGGVWTLESFTETGSGSDTISFSFRDDPAYIALDNVSVVEAGGTTTTGTTPEPSSFILMGSGVLALGGAIRRKLAR